MDKAHQRRYELLAVAVLITLWGGGGTLGDRSGYTDALFDPDYVIRHLQPGGVLDEAGFLVGDSVVSVEGTPVEELGMYSRWPRRLTRRPGESLGMVALRNGVPVEGRVVYREPPEGVERARLSLALVSMTFLWLGIWVLFTTPTPHAGRLAVVGLAAGLALPGPYLGSLNGLRDHLEVAAEILALALLFHFLLLFPVTRRPARKRWIGLVYVPWVALLACLCVELLTHPRLYHAFGGLIGILFLGYLVASLAALAVTALTTPLAEWGPRGVKILLGGFAVALVPNVVALVGWLIPPGFHTRGQEYFPLLLALIPASLALAVRREAASPPAPAGQPPPGGPRSMAGLSR